MGAAVIALYAAWCGLCWMLRGGKFGAIWRKMFGWEPGTTITRIGCAVLMAAPLGVIDPAYAACVVTIYAAMTIGYFNNAMGLEKPVDYLLMAFWGVVVLAIMLASNVTLAAFTFAPAGALVAVAYGINKPLGRRFGLDWTERAELTTGAVFGAALWSAAWA